MDFRLTENELQAFARHLEALDKDLPKIQIPNSKTAKRVYVAAVGIEIFAIVLGIGSACLHFSSWRAFESGPLYISIGTAAAIGIAALGFLWWQSCTVYYRGLRREGLLNAVLTLEADDDRLGWSLLFADGRKAWHRAGWDLLERVVESSRGMLLRHAGGQIWIPRGQFATSQEAECLERWIAATAVDVKKISIR